LRFIFGAPFGQLLRSFRDALNKQWLIFSGSMWSPSIKYYKATVDQAQQ